MSTEPGPRPNTMDILGNNAILCDVFVLSIRSLDERHFFSQIAVKSRQNRCKYRSPLTYNSITAIITQKIAVQNLLVYSHKKDFYNIVEMELKN